jgi:hypothetical protein
LKRYFATGIFLIIVQWSLYSKKSLCILPPSYNLISNEFVSFFEHEFHLSRTTINYNSQSKTYQFTIHIFIDDLTKCLEKKGFKNLNIGGKEATNTDEAIEKYIRENVILMGDKAIPYTYLGREFSDDQIALLIYLESTESPVRKNLAIKNSLLLEEFNDQKNIIDITKDKFRITQLLCDRSEDYKAFSF